MRLLRKIRDWWTWPERAIAEAEAQADTQAVTGPDGRRYVTWDRERTRRLIFRGES